MSSSGSRCLSAKQQASLKAFIDALLPPLPAPSDATAATSSATAAAAAVRLFWEHRLSQDPAYLKAVQDTLEGKLCSYDRFLIGVILLALSNAIGTSLIFGIFTVHAFVEWPVPERTVLLQRLETSSIASRRNIFQAFKRLLCGLAFSYTDTTGKNPFWEAMGFPGPPPTNDTAVQAAMKRQAGVQKAISDAKTDIKDVLECDIVICGSGCGGCVAAQVLSRAGFDVVVLEKGSYRSPENTNLDEADAMDQQYEQHGLVQTTNGSIMILAGEGVGGGSAINWSCCLPLPEYVREEWARDFGIMDDNDEYLDALKHMLDKIGASDKSKVTHNAMNRILQKGCDAMEYKWETTGQNLRDTNDTAAGYVGMGDRNGNKNAGVQTFLAEAVTDGANIIEKARVEHVLTATVNRQRRATGVQCIIDGGRHLTVHAKKSVILAAGSLQTPCILQRSGFRNKHIGKHLRLHPVTGMFCFMPPEKNVRSIVGAPMTTVCNQFALGPSGNGYGLKIENPVAYPGLLGAAIQWTSPRTYKSRILRYKNAVPLILLQRDSGEGGSIKTARDGVSLTIDYTVNKEDRQSMIHGMKGAARLLVAAGCDEVCTGHIRDFGFKPAASQTNGVNSNDSDDDKKLNEYLKSIESRGIKDHEIGLFSAHQMGTCRMSCSPQSGVVDSNAETWECDDLYIMDASVFPTASGSNPMVTVLTIAYMMSARLSLILKLRDDPEGKLFSFPADDRVKATKISQKRVAIRAQIHTGISVPKIGNLAIFLPLLVALVVGWFIGTGGLGVFSGHPK